LCVIFLWFLIDDVVDSGFYKLGEILKVYSHHNPNIVFRNSLFFLSKAFVFKVEMAKSFHSISEINTSETCWNLKARILRLWLVNDLNKNALPFSAELVLMDAEVKITFKFFFYCSYLANNVTYFL
jgi:hypothetical protein